MSPRRSGHLALAVAGLIAGLPAAAVLQWTRPIPEVVWCAMQQVDDDAGNPFVGGVLATRPHGPRLTLVSAPRVGVRKCGAWVHIQPATLDAVAVRLALPPRWAFRAFMPHIGRRTAIVDGWCRGGLPRTDVVAALMRPGIPK